MKQNRIRLLVLLILFIVAFLIGCVPQKVQLKGAWEFVGYKDERVKSIIDIDSTICFDGDGNGFYYSNDNPELTQRFTYLVSEDHKLVMIVNEEVSTVEYSINAKEKILSLDGLNYRLTTSEPITTNSINGGNRKSAQQTTDQAGEQIQNFANSNLEFENHANESQQPEASSSILDVKHAQLQETVDENNKELIAITVVVPSGSTVTIDFPNQDDYTYTNNDSKDVTRKVKIPVEVFYPNYPLEESEVEIKPDITITNADGSSYKVNCASFTRNFPKLNISVTSPVPDENGMIMAPESNVVSISGTIDDPTAEVSINGVVTVVYTGGVFMYDYKFNENATEDTEDTITITATKNNFVSDKKEVTVHAYKYIPQPMTLEVNNNGKTIHTDKNGKATITGKTLPGAELTATSNNTTNVLCGGVNVDPEGNFSFQVTMEESFYGMSVITLNAEKEGAENGSVKFTVTRGFEDKAAFVKFYVSKHNYIEIPSKIKIDELIANEAQYASSEYGFRIIATVVEVITVEGDTIVKMSMNKTNETVYVHNFSDRWMPGENVGAEYYVYVNFVGTYTDTGCCEFYGWVAKKS